MELEFVDREVEFELAWKTLAESWSTRKNPEKKPTLLVTGQMFGSGKTALGRRLLDFSNPRVEKLFRERPLQSDSGAAPLAEALTVTIDLQQYAPPSRQSPIELQFFLAKLVWCCTLTRFTGVSPEAANALWNKRTRLSLTECVTTLTSALNRSLLLHFDEVGTVEDSTWADFFPTNTSDDDTDQKRTIRRYYALWLALLPLLRHDRAFLYLTGKSTALSLIGRGLLGMSQSPSKVQQLTLGCFEIEHLDDLVNSVAGAEFLDLSSNDVKREFLDWLHRLTGGVPRLVSYALHYLVWKKYTARHVLEHDTAHHEVLTYVKTAPGGVLPLVGLSATQRADLEPMLVAAACGLVVELDTLLPGCNTSVEDLAMRYNLYMSRNGPIGVRLVMPGVWREQLKGAVSADYDWRFIPAIPSQLSDSGKVLEHICGIVMLLRARTAGDKASAGAVFPLLAATKAGSCCVSGMVSAFSPNRASKELMRKYAEKKEPCIVAWATGSPSGDRLLILPSSGSLPVLVEPQCKNTIFSVDGLRDEIAKCDIALSMMDGTKPCASSVVLLIIATELTADMAMMTECAVWKAGTHVVAMPRDLKDKEKKLKGVKKTRALQRSKGELVIPKGLEVVVASVERVKDLLGAQQYEMAVQTRLSK